MAVHYGGCHCGAVAFEVEAPSVIDAIVCNCSICSMSGFLHMFVSRDQFQLTRGESDITCYTFNTGVAQHYFCKHCGVKSFYVPRSHPDGYSVNVHCLRQDSIEEVRKGRFDGKQWEQSIPKLSPLSD